MYFSGTDGRPQGEAENTRPAACPKCGSSNMAAIRYGMPGPEPDETTRGGVVLGGCVIDERARQWQCLSSNVSFNDGGTDMLEPIDYRPEWVRQLQQDPDER